MIRPVARPNPWGRKRAAAAGSVGQAADHGHGEAAEGIQIGGDDLEQEIGLARDRPAGRHLVQAHHFGLEQPGLGFGMHADAGADEGLHAQAQPPAIELHAIAADHAQLLQPPHPAPAGRGREADCLGQILIAHPAVALKGAHDPDVGGIEADLGHDPSTG